MGKVGFSLIFFTILQVLAASPINSDNTIPDHRWYAWKKVHSKSYENFEEEHFRYVIWNENMKMISNHNAAGKHSYLLAMNHLGDMTAKEVKAMLNGYNSVKSKERKFEGEQFLPLSNVMLPNQVDWRTKGYVTPVKNQGQCGSCWAFSTTGSLEGQHFKKTGKLVSLSEQNLVDCSRDYGNNGCEGGLMDYAFKYIKANKGIDTEASYPYLAVDAKCHFNASYVGATDTGFVGITKGDESALKSATASVGPISVAIDASHFSFQFYHSGVYNETSCSSTALDHGVLVVGYGTSAQGQDYWLVKNSWGQSWGMKGYIMMSRNKQNQCGIATEASYPLV